LIYRQRLALWAGIFIILLLVSGCSGRLLLTKDNSYSIIMIAPDGKTQERPIQLTWNSNAAVMQELLLEASFVLSDLHTPRISEEELGQTAEKKEHIDSESTTGKLRKTSVAKTESFPGLVSDFSNDTVYLEAKFPLAKQFNLMIDDEQYNFDVSIVRIEVQGKNPGRVILNEELEFQGIPNPNLVLAYEEFTRMQVKTQREAGR
jgi:hypothetical protein